jgi:hypothetical protein
LKVYQWPELQVRNEAKTIFAGTYDLCSLLPSFSSPSAGDQRIFSFLFYNPLINTELMVHILVLYGLVLITYICLPIFYFSK